MSITGIRTIIVAYEGDVSGVNNLEAANNTTSPGQTQFVVLVPTDNTLTKPTGAQAVSIKPPVGNTTAITWKGSTTADTGIVLHTTDPTSIAFTTALTQIVLSVATTVSGVQLYWS